MYASMTFSCCCARAVGRGGLGAGTQNDAPMGGPRIDGVCCSSG